MLPNTWDRKAKRMDILSIRGLAQQCKLLKTADVRQNTDYDRFGVSGYSGIGD